MDDTSLRTSTRSFALDQTARAHARHVGTGTADGFETCGNFFFYGSVGSLYVVGLLLRCQFDVYFARDRQRDFILLGTIVPPEHPYNIAWGSKLCNRSRHPLRHA